MAKELQASAKRRSTFTILVTEFTVPVKFTLPFTRNKQVSKE